MNHRTAPVDIREQFAVSETAVAQAAERLRAQAGCREAFVVSTCNRVEVYAAAEDAARAGPALMSAFAELARAAPEAATSHTYAHHGPAALRHLFRVAASLDSMVVGEPQILGQLKSAYGQCHDAGVTGSTLDRAVARAFSVAKRVRNETGIAQSSVSVSSVAVDLAEQIFGELSRCETVLIGAGKMGELAARSFVTAGVGNLLVANRSFDRAQEVAGRLGGHPRGLDELDELLVTADIVVSSTGAPGYLVDKERVKRVQRRRKYRPLFLIDIAVPRDIDPGLNDLDNTFVYDIDDLSSIAAENLESRRREADAAEAMVADEARRFEVELRQQIATPTIVALRQKAQAIRDAELERTMKRLGDLDPKQRKSVEMMADGIVKKLLHDVMVGLKRATAADDAVARVETVRAMFGLDGAPHGGTDEDPDHDSDSRGTERG